jgi:hypothetical protein
MKKLADMYAPQAFPFKVGEAEYQAMLGLGDVAALERECQAGLSAIGQMLIDGHTAILIQVIVAAVKKKTEVGFQRLEDLAEVGTLMRSTECVVALSEALSGVGNALSGGKPSPAPLEIGSKSD